jgi:hypothetical protein
MIDPGLHLKGTILTHPIRSIQEAPAKTRRDTDVPWWHQDA